MLAGAAAGDPMTPMISLVSGVLIDAFGKKRQKHASCEMVCTVVPANLTLQTIKENGRVVLHHDTPADPRFSATFELTAPRPGGFEWGEWASWADPVFRVESADPGKSPFLLPANHQALAHLSEQAAREGKHRCPATTVCAKFKNWSASWPRQVSLSVELNHGAWASNSCLDPSVISREARVQALVGALQASDMLGEALKAYKDAIR